MKVSCDGVSLDKPLLFGSLMLVEHLFLIVTRVNSENVLDAGLRIGGKRASDELEGKDSDKQGEAWCVLRKKLVDNWLNLNLSLAGLSWPLYIGGQVSKNRSGSIQITT
jgi:hypothetical protein